MLDGADLSRVALVSEYPHGLTRDLGVSIQMKKHPPVPHLIQADDGIVVDSFVGVLGYRGGDVSLVRPRGSGGGEEG